MANKAEEFFKLFNQERMVRDSFLSLFDRLDAHQHLSPQDAETLVKTDNGFKRILSTLGAELAPMATQAIEAFQVNLELRKNMRLLIGEINKNGPLTQEDWNLLEQSQAPARLLQFEK
jgi:hypothetical protein